ncbi:MAG: STAS domain-containing protein [Clostridia bacterium]|nr:STAS domain-containing protein [Clostridia bacterium]
MDKRIEAYSHENIQVIQFLERLTYDAIPFYKEEFFSAIVPAFGYVLDLRKVSWIDSTGIGLLVSGLKRIVNEEQPVSVIVTSELIRKLLHISKLDELFYVTDDLDDALRYVKKN